MKLEWWKRTSAKVNSMCTPPTILTKRYCIIVRYSMTDKLTKLEPAEKLIDNLITRLFVTAVCLDFEKWELIKRKQLIPDS